MIRRMIILAVAIAGLGVDVVSTMVALFDADEPDDDVEGP